MLKKPWPKDAVVLVCASPEAARREVMESIHPGHCRDCGADVVADGRTLRRAMQPDLAHGRPVALLCVDCFPVYDFDQVTRLIDHRAGKSNEYGKAVR